MDHGVAAAVAARVARHRGQDAGGHRADLGLAAGGLQRLLARQGAPRRALPESRAEGAQVFGGLRVWLRLDPRRLPDVLVVVDAERLGAARRRRARWLHHQLGGHQAHLRPCRAHASRPVCHAGLVREETTGGLGGVFRVPRPARADLAAAHRGDRHWKLQAQLRSIGGKVCARRGAGQRRGGGHGRLPEACRGARDAPAACLRGREVGAAGDARCPLKGLVCRRVRELAAPRLRGG
mmetsp:Transcript_138598/g.345680  ORF Transcript_138598/g.345680 Transcript_138598/m.345680 type:complete len:237 (-) Transcript_138598:155-865(-)